MAAVTLAEVQTAINSVATGAQSYTMSDGRQVTKADLAELRKLEKDLARAASGRLKKFRWKM